VELLVNTFFETRLQDLFNLAARVEQAFGAAGIEYRVVGGLATYLYVEESEADAGRLTKDIDIAVRREDLPRIIAAVEPFGLEFRHTAGVDMLVQKGQPSARRAVHMLFEGERVRPADPEPIPGLGADRKIRGISVTPLAHLVTMKLISFRLKDQAHLKDLDEQKLITPEIEAVLPPVLRERLAQVRAHD
jgi:hypothetical protein